MERDRFEAAMFWVGALLAFLPVLIGLGIWAFLWWSKRHKPAENKPPSA